MLRSVSDVVKATVIVALFGITVTFGLVTRITLYRVSVELDLLRDRFDAHVATQKDTAGTVNDRLIALEKVVYASPSTSTAEPPRKPVALEQWIMNADNEMRARIKALEEWRMRQER